MKYSALSCCGLFRQIYAYLIQKLSEKAASVYIVGINFKVKFIQLSVRTIYNAACKWIQHRENWT